MSNVVSSDLRCSGHLWLWQRLSRLDDYILIEVDNIFLEQFLSMIVCASIGALPIGS